MRQCGCFCLSVLACLLAVVSAQGQTFTYSEDFNLYIWGQKPNGWNTLSSMSATNPELDPQVMTGDPLTWATPADYNVAWSGGARFNMIHPGLNTTGRQAAAWFSGQGATYTGNYPMNLQTDSIKAEFDVSMRKGSNGNADGGVFAILPVTTDLATAIQSISSSTQGAALGWGGLPGLAIEIDIYNNNNLSATPQQTSEPVQWDAVNNKWANINYDSSNHVGVDVYATWQASISRLYSVTTEINAPTPVYFTTSQWFRVVSDNNQPLHFTMYYNDPAEGGPGTVRVYLKVRASDYQGTGTAISFGEDPGDAPDGKLVLQACVGAFPTPQAIFGFTGSIGGQNNVFEVDNINVQTNTADMSNPCTTSQYYINPGTAAALNSADSQGACETAVLSQPGWDLQTYMMMNTNDIAGLKNSIAYAEAPGNNLRLATITGEPALNYEDGTLTWNLSGKVAPPGCPTPPSGHYGFLAKGWICFPAQAADYHSYLSVNCDDGFELMIGSVVVGTGTGRSTGIDAGTLMDLTVPAAGGVYPIQLLYYQAAGSGGIEFYRRVPEQPMEPFVLVGASDGGLADQPKVYGLLNGNPPPDQISTYTGWAPPTVTLSSSDAVGSGTGNQVFKLKVVNGPMRWDGTNKVDIPDIYLNRSDLGAQTALRYLDVLNDVSGGATTATLNFRGAATECSGALAGDTFPFPGEAASATQFAMRAEGFITFPTAGNYLVGFDSDDDGYLRIGSVVAYSGANANRALFLSVPAPGTYPIRVDHAQGNGASRLNFYQPLGGPNPTGGAARVAVNDPADPRVLRVYESATSGPYAWAPNGCIIPADRKVAATGSGNNLGWNSTLSKTTVAPLSSLVPNKSGVATELFEDDWYWVGTNKVTKASEVAPYLAYVDCIYTTPTLRLQPQRPISVFNHPNIVCTGTTGNSNYAITARGYVDFPTAGDYGFNMAEDDGAVMWIGGVMVNGQGWGTSGYNDNTPGVVRITDPGMYDIRVDYYEAGPSDNLMVYQYLPSGTEVLLNDPGGQGVKVYTDLTVAPLTTAWSNPVRLPLSAKVAEINRGGTSGMLVQEVNGTFLEGDGNGGIGHERLRTLAQATELLDSVLGITPSLRLQGTLINSFAAPQVNFAQGSSGGLSTGWCPYGGTCPNANYFVARVSGLLALKAGGHIFSVVSDDGVNFWLGDYNLGWCGANGGFTSYFYAWVPADGLYPFHFDYNQGTGNQKLTFAEIVLSGSTFTAVNINTGSASKAYTTINPCNNVTLWADNDLDGDVDEDDFGAFQACFTGVSPAQQPQGGCACFDRDKNGDVSGVDLNAFENCATGPGILWTQALKPLCVP